MFIDLPVSGIHRLLTGASSKSAHSSRAPIESVAEESHTYDLLYPDPNTLHQAHDHAYPLKYNSASSAASSAASFDDRGGLDIHSPQDIRILIAQDGNALSQQPKVLYDSNPPPPLPSSRLGSPNDFMQDEVQSPLEEAATRSPTKSNKSPASKHGRYFSFGQISSPPPRQQTSPLSPEPSIRGGLGSPRLRRGSIRPVTSEGETVQSRLAREGREDTDALLGCMFGSTGLPVVSGTKLHIRPQAPYATQISGDANPVSPEPSAARLTTRRRTPLTRSTTADDLQLSASAPSDYAKNETARSRSTSVLITRVFSVDTRDVLVLQPSNTSVISSKTSIGSSLESAHQRPSNVFENTKAKQTKTPSFAVAVVLRLPQSAYNSTSSDETPWEEAQYMNGSVSIADQDLERVMTHWNIVSRAMASLERVAQQTIRHLLLELENNHPSSFIQAPPEISRNWDDELKVRKPKASSQRVLQLTAGALQRYGEIQEQVIATGSRIALALRIRRVITGQGRWGIWREEARWVGKWAGSREQNFFFFNILTAFLGCHTDWLRMINSAHKKHSKRKDKKFLDQAAARHRTVIVSADKMAARRLIFLLSAFFPSPAVTLDGMTRSWSSSTAAYSQSPPTGISILREQSLRRTINRRQRGSRLGPGASGTHGRSLSLAAAESAIVGDENQALNNIGQLHSRRTSNTNSVKAPSLPIATSGEKTRKSSTTTTSTVIPDAALPVAHFSNASEEPLGTTAMPRPGSSGSLASLSLKHALTRSESYDQTTMSIGSQPASRWGSMMSGFWSNRRGSSTDDSEFSARDGLCITGMSSHHTRQISSGGKLARMVEEAEQLSKPTADESRLRPGPLSPSAANVSPNNDETAVFSPVEPTPAKTIPEQPHKKVEHFPLKLSIDESDGVIDVDLPNFLSNSYSSSFASDISSPEGAAGGAGGTAASSFNDRASTHLRSPSKDRAPASEPAVNVAGWLREYHPDFALQAVRPYERLKQDVRISMKEDVTAKHMPIGGDASAAMSKKGEQWVDAATTLLADTTNFTITKLRAQTCVGADASAETQERIVEEPVMDLDATLTDAVEKVLGHSGRSSRACSVAPSRAASPARAPTMKAAEQKSDAAQRVRSGEGHQAHLEVPKSECKRLVLGALEQVVRSVEREVEGRSGGSSRGIGIAGEPRRGGNDTNTDIDAVGVESDSALREGVRRWLSGEG
ncbi:MAG: hypothetical protein LQ351_005485 [Letrouitia transgressa]|nr:MAG: hypothetical protein LQ351_005485 [Letrouitia transgressa]